MSFTAAPVGICLLALDGRIQRVNDALCRLLARNEEQLLDVRLEELTQPGDADDEAVLMRETIDGVREGYELDKRYVTSTGDVVDTRLSVVLVRDADGNAVHCIAQIVDLTALVHARRELAPDHGPSSGDPRLQPDGDLHARPGRALDRRQPRDVRDHRHARRGAAREEHGRHDLPRALRAPGRL